ncbi:MAG: tRNA (adenosine(37)-N6)-dimethylallyltransferase MiaA [Chloroflexota bacterium]|nr:tRNA (adenosine(37)-N6)-dimethylallyltransferase MiaA [Chloroflexota bacterium]GIK29172.1 MAG: tRNA dimethylallyltransferase [Chloroflexota bacterium]
MAGKPLIVILGPTAVGKTTLAIDFAVQVDGEIVSADSRQIYRFMDIGTAKPTRSQQRAVRHHLLDKVDPDEDVSLTDVQRWTYDAIDDIHQRGKLPLLVGGTGQYISAVIDGWGIPQAPPNAALRRELEAVAAREGADALHARLRTVDPVAADAIPYQNVRRVVRALEVYLETGRPISEQQRKSPPPYTTAIIGLTMERAALYARADARVDQMLAAGFVAEVRMLLDRGYSRSLPAMSGIGYKELAAHLLDSVPLNEAVAAIKHATHDFIRRQYTWFRKMGERVLWHNVQDVDTRDWVRLLDRLTSA